jgi:hypothetical protein
MFTVVNEMALAEARGDNHKTRTPAATPRRLSSENPTTDLSCRAKKLFSRAKIP